MLFKYLLIFIIINLSKCLVIPCSKYSDSCKNMSCCEHLICYENTACIKNKVGMSWKLFLINTYKTFKLQPRNEPSVIEYFPL